MVNWIKHNSFCFSKKLYKGIANNLGFSKIDLLPFKRFSKLRHGGKPTIQSVHFFSPNKSQKSIPIKSTCLIYLPKRLGISIEVSSDNEDWTSLKSSNFFGRLIVLKENTFAKIYTNRETASLNSVMLFYNEDVPVHDGEEAS